MTSSSGDDLLVEEFPAGKRSLRLAVVTETYPPEVNGVARTLACVVEGLRARNHDIQLVRPGQSAGDAAGDAVDFHEVLIRGMPIPRYPHLRVGITSRRALVRLWTLRRPDLVHIATEGPMGWCALQAARQLKLPVCSDFRTNFHAYSGHYGIGWLRKPIMAYLRKFHNQASCTMVPDEGLRATLAALDLHNLTVVGRGVDTALFDPARRSEALRRSWGVRPNDLVVLHVGRLAPEKNLVTLAMAFETIQRAAPSVRLVLVGDGPSRAELQARCPGAVFAGMRSGDDLAAHYASGDLFVFPSMTETFGNVTLEAMASGLPVLAYDYAAAAQLVKPGHNGMVASLGNMPAFLRMADALAGDPVALRQMGANARATASQLGWDQIIDSIEAIYQAVLCGAQLPQARTARPMLSAQPA